MPADALVNQDAEAARRVFFGIVDGLGERGRKQWRHLSPVNRITMIETILQGFNE